jgi:hypothetical protein
MIDSECAVQNGILSDEYDDESKSTDYNNEILG